jgi:hypothetical protein
MRRCDKRDANPASLRKPADHSLALVDELLMEIDGKRGPGKLQLADVSG